jgi:DNA replication protein DnaC
MVRNTWRKDSEKTETQVLQMLASIDLLVMDEIGVQYGTDAEQVTLFDIIDKRYRDMMPTILLTNLNAKLMREFLGDRSYDRLREGGLWVPFDWESHRGRRAA